MPLRPSARLSSRQASRRSELTGRGQDPSDSTTLRLWRDGALSADAVEQDGGGLVGGVLGHQLAPERLGEDRGFQSVEQLDGASSLSFEAVGAGE